MATPEGFEPPTRCLGCSRSIQLSYGVARALYRMTGLPLQAPPAP
jgi:hypothetical protein